MARNFKTGVTVTGDSKGAVSAMNLTSKGLGDLNKKAKETEAGFRSFSKSVVDGLGKAAATAARYGTIAAGAATAAGAAMIKSGLASVDSLAKTSDKLGVTTEALAQMRFAAEQTGVSTGTMDMALQRMTRRVAEAAQGSGEAVNALKELGISAEDLVKKSPDQMFRQITDSMGGVENQADKVRLAMKLFDSEGVALVNTMKGGTAALDQFAAEADAAGLSISRIDAAKVEAANDAFNRVRSVVTGLSQQLAIRFAPILEGIADRMFGIATESGGAANAVGKAFSFMTKAAGVFANGVRGIQIGWNTMLLAFQLVARHIVTGWDSAARAMVDIWNKLPFVDKVEYTSVFDGFLLTMESAIRESKAEIDKLLMAKLPSDAIDEFVAESERAFEAQAIVAAKSSALMVDSLEEITVTAQRVAKEDFTALTKAAEENADGVAVAYARGIERMDDGFADFFKTILRDGKVTFDGLKNIFLDTLAEMIYAAARNRIIVGLGFGGGAGSALGAGGSAASGLGGLGSIGSVLMSGIGGIGASAIGGIAGLGNMLGLGAQTGAFLGSTGQLGFNALSGLGITGAGAGTSFLAGAGLTAGAGILGGMGGTMLGESLFGKQANSGWGAGIGGIGGAVLGGPLGAFVGGAIGGALDAAFGSSKNRIGGVGINTGTREANLWGTQRPEYQDPMRELAGLLQGFSDAIGGSGSIMTISQGNKSPLQMDGVEFASVADLVNAALDNILETAWELAPAVKDLAQAFKGSVEETAAFAVAMQGLWRQASVNPVSQAIDDFAAAQRTAFDVYRGQSDALRTLMSQFDGSTTSAQQLTQALAGTQQIAYQLTQQFMQARQQIGEAGAASAQSIRESAMSEQELRESLFAQRKGLREQISTLSDPAAVQKAVQDALGINQRLFQMIDDPTADQAEKFASTAESLAEVADRRIERLIRETRQESQQQNNEIRDLLRDAAVDAQQTAATNQQAAGIMLQAAQILSGALGGQQIGSEVRV